MARPRTYTVEQLARAIAVSTSWRGTLRELGLLSRSSGATRSVRSYADRLGLDYSHFSGQRRWSDHALSAAIPAADSWADVAETLQITSATAIATLKGHAARLDLDVAHLAPPVRAVATDVGSPCLDRLDRAGSLLAAARYTLCGHDVSWPLEPNRYDLLVATDVGVRRVQVKTTTTRVASTWKVYLSTSGGERRTYDPNEIDEFFVIDGELNYYAIPLAVVGGLHAIHLKAYDRFRVARDPVAL